MIANIGDASAGCGPVWEALCFATMDQFKELWDESHRGGLPLIMNFVNNFYGMGGQPVGETMGFKILARLGAGLTPEQMHAERVDGYNPLAVIDAIRRKTEIIERGDGPVLLGHGDLSLQRPFALRRQLLPREERGRGLAGGRPARHVRREPRRRRRVHAGRHRRSCKPGSTTIILKAYRKAIDLDDLAARRPEERRLPARSGDVLQRAASRRWPTASREVNHPLAENPRVAAARQAQPQRPRRDGPTAAEAAVRSASATRSSRRSSTASTPIRR